MSSTVKLALVLTLGAVGGLSMRTWAGPPERSPAEPERGVDVAAAVEGVTTLVTITTEGTRVKPGDVIAELDRLALQDRLDDRKAEAAQAAMDLDQAHRLRVEAERSLVEYRDVLHPLELEGIEGEIAVARAALELANGNYNLAQVPTPQEAQFRQAATVEFLRARTALKQAEGRRMILTKYENPRRLRELEEAILRARTQERALQQQAARARAKVERLRRELDLCTLAAPVAGRVVLAHTAAFGPNPGPAIGPGAVVVRGQVLARVVPDDTRQSRAR
jgi:HlyD family secretion protein